MAGCRAREGRRKKKMVLVGSLALLRFVSRISVFFRSFLLLFPPSLQLEKRLRKYLVERVVNHLFVYRTRPSKFWEFSRTPFELSSSDYLRDRDLVLILAGFVDLNVEYWIRV